MDVEILSRIQFAFTIAFHYIYPPLIIGLGFIMFIMISQYLRTGEKDYEILAKFCTQPLIHPMILGSTMQLLPTVFIHFVDHLYYRNP